MVYLIRPRRVYKIDDIFVVGLIYSLSFGITFLGIDILEKCLKKKKNPDLDLDPERIEIEMVLYLLYIRGGKIYESFPFPSLSTEEISEIILKCTQDERIYLVKHPLIKKALAVFLKVNLRNKSIIIPPGLFKFFAL